jgi:hypothetical protein
VDVYRGTVAVIPKQQRLAYDVPAGRGSMMKHRSTFECTAPTTDSLLKALPVPPPIEAQEEISYGVDDSQNSSKASEAKGKEIAKSEIVDFGSPTGANAKIRAFR